MSVNPKSHEYRISHEVLAISLKMVTQCQTPVMEAVGHLLCFAGYISKKQEQGEMFVVATYC